MVLWTPIIGGFITIAIITIGIIITIKLTETAKRIDIPPNAPLIEIMDTSKLSFTDGYGSGIVKTKRLNSNTTYFIEFYPTDVSHGELSPKPGLKSFVINAGLMRESYDSSSRRTKIYILSRHIKNHPRALQGTKVSEEMGKEGQLEHIRTIVGDWVTAGDDALLEAMKEYSRSGITRYALESMKQRLEELEKKAIATQSKEEEPQTKQ